METANIKFLTDIPCEVYIDDELVLITNKNAISKISLLKGEYLIKVVSTINANIHIKEVVFIEYEKIFKVDFLSKKEFAAIFNQYIYWDKNISAFKNIFTSKLVSKCYPYCTSYIGTGEFYEGRAIVGIQEKCGYVNSEGVEVIECIYEYPDNFYEGRASVSKDGKYGFIDLEGNVVIPFIYNSVHRFSEGLAGVKKGSYWGFVDKQGKEVIPCKYISVGSFSEGIVAVKPVNERWGYIDRWGNSISAFCYYGAEEFEGGIAQVRKEKWCDGYLVDERYGYINTRGQEVFPCIYDKIFASDNVAQAQINNKWGCIDYSGNILIPFEYEELTFVNDDLARVKQNNKYGILDKSGNIIAPFIYDGMSLRMVDNMIGARMEGKWGVIDCKGNVITPFIYDYIDEFYEGIARVRKGDRRDGKGFIYGKYGFINKEGVEIISCIYDNAWYFNRGYTWVYLNNIFYHIDRYGKIL